MTLENVEICFQKAMQDDWKFVGVKIEMAGFHKPEIIINSRENFEAKLAYYQKAYNKDLTLKTFNGIKIVGFTFGNSFDEIEKDLVD